MLAHIGPWSALLGSWATLGIGWLAFGCMSGKEIDALTVALTGIWRNRKSL